MKMLQDRKTIQSESDMGYRNGLSYGMPILGLTAEQTEARHAENLAKCWQGLESKDKLVRAYWEGFVQALPSQVLRPTPPATSLVGQYLYFKDSLMGRIVADGVKQVDWANSPQRIVQAENGHWFRDPTQEPDWSVRKDEVVGCG